MDFIEIIKKYPMPINIFITILKIMEYSNNNKLSNKGILFAHDITKTVVESLPFPIQNKHIIENYNEYMNAHE